MNIQGTVVSYTANKKVKKQGGGQYDAWELVYRTLEDEMKVIAKPVQGLRFAPALAAQLNGLKPDDAFTAQMEKNEGGFWEVKSIVKGHEDGAAVVSNSGGNGSSGRVASRSGVTPKSTYETPEERAKRQVSIGRQWAVNAAIASFGPDIHGGVEVLQEQKVLKRAAEFEKFIYKDLGKAATKYLQVELLDKEAAKPEEAE